MQLLADEHALCMNGFITFNSFKNCEMYCLFSNAAIIMNISKVTEYIMQANSFIRIA